MESHDQDKTSQSSQSHIWIVLHLMIILLKCLGQLPNVTNVIPMSCYKSEYHKKILTQTYIAAW